MKFIKEEDLQEYFEMDNSYDSIITFFNNEGYYEIRYFEFDDKYYSYGANCSFKDFDESLRDFIEFDTEEEMNNFINSFLDYSNDEEFNDKLEQKIKRYGNL